MYDFSQLWKKVIFTCIMSFWPLFLKVTLAVSPQFFSIWTRVLNHDKYVEIKQFSKVDIKQNDISTVILLIKFLVYQWDPRHLHRSRFFLHIYLHFIFVFYLISNHIFVYINHKDTCNSDNKWCAQRIIEFTDEKLKLKVQIEDGFIYSMN